MLLAHRVVACGRGHEILTPQTLLSTFGIAGKYQEGRVVIVEREHGHEECGENRALPASAEPHRRPHEQSRAGGQRR